MQYLFANLLTIFFKFNVLVIFFSVLKIDKNVKRSCVMDILVTIFRLIKNNDLSQVAELIRIDKATYNSLKCFGCVLFLTFFDMM